MPQTNLVKASKNAFKIGVKIKESTVKGKKLDVFKDNVKVASIGDIKYSDYLIHQDKNRQKNYLSRHAKTRVKIGSPSYYAANILWK